ncbi:MAG: lipocalin family protein, partial [Gammaproteobacteria bacterium]
SSEQLGVEDFDLSASDFWQDERGVHWPSRWELSLPRRGLSFRIEPLVRDQLMRTTLRYWEGAVDVTGSEDGVGYMELTGYGDDR